jgi:hypothetical protein
MSMLTVPRLKHAGVTLLALSIFIAAQPNEFTMILSAEGAFADGRPVV